MAWWPGVHSYSQCILAMEVSSFAWYWYSHLWVILRTARIIMLRGLDDFDLGFSDSLASPIHFSEFSLKTPPVVGLYIFDSKTLRFKTCPFRELHLQQLRLNTYHAAAAFTACKRTTTSVPEKWPWTLEILEELQGRLFGVIQQTWPPLKRTALCSGVRC